MEIKEIESIVREYTGDTKATVKYVRDMCGFYPPQGDCSGLETTIYEKRFPIFCNYPQELSKEEEDKEIEKFVLCIKNYKQLGKIAKELYQEIFTESRSNKITPYQSIFDRYVEYYKLSSLEQRFLLLVMLGEHEQEHIKIRKVD